MTILKLQRNSARLSNTPQSTELSTLKDKSNSNRGLQDARVGGRIPGLREHRQMACTPWSGRVTRAAVRSIGTETWNNSFTIEVAAVRASLCSEQAGDDDYEYTHRFRECLP